MTKSKQVKLPGKIAGQNKQVNPLTDWLTKG
jgi:hypothetical protein